MNTWHKFVEKYTCDYCNNEIDFGNVCSTCKSKIRRGVKLVKLYKKGVKIGVATDNKCLELDRIVKGGSKIGVDSSEKLTVADMKTAFKKINKRCISLENSSYVMVLPQVFKKYPKEVEKMVNSYKKTGKNVVVVFNQPIKHGERIAKAKG